MNCKHKLQTREGTVYTKSSLTFLFIQTYSFVGLYKRERKRRKRKKTEGEKEQRKKGPFWWNVFARLFTSKLPKKSQVSKDSFQLIFHFWFARRLQNCAIICHGPRDKAKKESRNFSSLIGFFGDGQHYLANRMAGFYMMQVFTERYFRTDINSKFLVILLSESYLWQWLNMPSKVGQLCAARSGQ